MMVPIVAMRIPLWRRRRWHLMLPNYFYAFDSVDTRTRCNDYSLPGYHTATNIKAQRRLGELNTGKYRRDWRVRYCPELF